MKQLKADLKLKDGRQFPAGAIVDAVAWRQESPNVALVSIGGQAFRLHAKSLAKFVTGFKCPSMATLEKWHNEGYCKSVTGKHVEPDGYGPDGAPSWLLAMGMI